MAYKLAESEKKCRTLGPLIHNDYVTDDLKRIGVGIISSPDDTLPGETILIRAHGVGPQDCERIEARGGTVCDATCPFVKKIHGIVSENSGEDIPVLIAGDANHPEVIGIRGYCRGESYVFSCEEELRALIADNPGLKDKEKTAVSQTTFSENEWKKCKKIIDLLCTNTKIFDTICSATRKRQEEAYALSQKCDAVIVVGGRHSSNTVKLKKVCEENCDTFLVERASELKNINFSMYAAVGVTAGASTPTVIIKEVLSAMSEIIETTNNQVEEVPSVATSADNESFDSLISESLVDDSVIKCTVEGITATEIQVDIPKNHILGGLTGIVPFEEYSDDPEADPTKELKVGDIINLVIMKKNDLEGTVRLSKKRADRQKSWIDIVEAKEDGRVLEGTVIDVNTHGVLVSYKGATVFVPGSLATERRGDSVDDLLKKNVKFCIIDIDDRRQRAVGSIRKAIQEDKKELSDAFWATAEEGKVYNGTVKSLTNYGAFVDIGGVDGMVHISEMSWRRIKHPSEVFQVGQEVMVFIKALNRETGKISLGYRRDEDNPWIILQKNYPVGTVIEAEIANITDFGAFAKVIPGIDGLIHKSQIANRFVENPAEILHVGDKVQCKITAIDFDKRRVSLSIRALHEDEEAEEETAEVTDEPLEVPVDIEKVIAEEAAEAAEAVEEAAEAPAEAAEESAEAVEKAAEAPAEAAEEAAEAVEEAVEAPAEAVEEAAEAVEEAVEAPAEAVEEAAEAVEEAVEAPAEAAEAVEEAVEAPVEVAEEAAAEATEAPAEPEE